MKKDTHPDYQDVLFEDSSTGAKFLIGSTLKPKETETFEGKKYPVYRVSVSSASHPFFTGSSQLVDAEGRVDKFTKRYQKKQVQAQEQIAKQEKESEKKETKTGKAAKKPSKAVSKKK